MAVGQRWLDLTLRLAAIASAASRRLGRGQGTVIGGRVVTSLVPARRRRAICRPADVTLVSGTNGKTTTVALLTTAMRCVGVTATNSTGSNLLSGLYNALLAEPGASHAVLEVDEAVLPRALDELDANRLVLLNLSRDQLDRNHEVRKLADAWRLAVARRPGLRVVANVDDPLVAWAAGAASEVVWVSVGQPWRHDATLCPGCDHHLTYYAAGWHCEACGLHRSAPTYVIDRDDLVSDATGRRWPIECALPGRANLGNAAMAMVAAIDAGCPPADVGASLRDVTSVQGRYGHHSVDGHDVRLILAKNPAGWQETLSELRPGAGLVVTLNAEAVDGLDPSWIWDVSFEELRGREVVCAGRRALDLAVRLDYADVDHATFGDGLTAVRSLAVGPVDVVGDYSSFTEMRHRLGESTRA